MLNIIALVFDNQTYINDVVTPNNWKPGTIIRRYGFESKTLGKYPDVVDVVFDSRPDKESKSHFTDNIRCINCGRTLDINLCCC